MVMFWPSIHPRSSNALEKAAPTAVKAGVAGLRYPIVRLFRACCARAASGHATVALLSNDMNSRRLMGIIRKAKDDHRVSIAGRQGRASQQKTATHVRVGSN